MEERAEIEPATSGLQSGAADKAARVLLPMVKPFALGVVIAGGSLVSARFRRGS